MMGISDLESESAASSARDGARPEPGHRPGGRRANSAARATRSPFLADYLDFDDWLDRCEGLQIGLAMAGVDATIVPVRLGRFLEWMRLTARASRRARARRVSPTLALAMRSASVRMRWPLSANWISSRIPGASPLSPATATPPLAAASRGAAGETRGEPARGSRTLPICVDAFVDWCACLGQAASRRRSIATPSSLLEHLTTFD